MKFLGVLMIFIVAICTIHRCRLELSTSLNARASNNSTLTYWIKPDICNLKSRLPTGSLT